MKTVKILGLVFILLVAIVAGLIVYVFNNINQLVKEAVETVGPEITQTYVGLKEVDIELTKGRGELNHFVIGNPEGFSRDPILTWESIALEIDPSSISSKVVVIRDVVIKGVEVHVEQKGMSTNVQALLDNVSSGNTGEEIASSDGGSSTSSQSDVKLMLEHMRFEDNSVEITTEKWGSYTAKMPSFKLHQIGDKNTGLTPEELGQAILIPVLKQIKDQVAERLKSISKEKLKEKLKEKEAEIKAKIEEKKAEVKNKADAKKEEIEAKLEDKKSELDDKMQEEKDNLGKKKEELQDKLDKEVKDKFNHLFD